MPDLKRLRQLILMLSSEHDGEIGNASRAIDKILKAEKLDWHWMADKLTGPAPPPQHPKIFNHKEAAEWLLDDKMRNILNEREVAFLTTILKWNGRPTEKQMKWLLKLCAEFNYPTV